MKDLLTHVKEQYFFEAERRDKLNSSSTFAIGLATLSGSIVASGFANLDFPIYAGEVIAIVFMIIWLACICTFGYHVVRFFLGPIYKYVASAESVKTHYFELDVFFKANPVEAGRETAFDEFLLDTFSRSATVNCENNDKKSNRLYLMNKWVIMSVIPSFLAGVSLAFASKFEPAEPQRIVIVAEPKGPSPTPTPAPRPTPPPERSIKDGANSPPPKRY